MLESFAIHIKKRRDVALIQHLAIGDGRAQDPPLRLQGHSRHGFHQQKTKKVTNVFAKWTICIIFAFERFAPRD